MPKYKKFQSTEEQFRSSKEKFNCIKDSKKLELACGSGQFSFSLSNMTKSWIGTDFSEQMIIEAKKRGGGDNLSFEVADAGNLSFSNEKFNCVLIANALHIMPKADRAMREI